MKDSPPSFRCLGYDNGYYYYYSFLLQKVIHLKPTEHRKENLYMLASLADWRRDFHDDENRVSWQSAVDSVMRTCSAEGIFNPARIRGRGIWWIDGKPVTHYGDKVYIDGEHKSPRQITSGKDIYEVAESLRDNTQPLPNADFTLLQGTLENLKFKIPDAALFLAGWMVCSMAAGAIHWRSHIWITGRRGSGKSAVVAFIRRCLGKCAEFYVGETTEAGIRQDLKHDCRAVIFDEAEPKSPAAMLKIQGVLTLARQASSDETGKIAKGTVTGRGMNFVIRSCFCMGSINMGTVEAADKSRFTQLEMGDPMDKAEFKKWQYKADKEISPEYMVALHQRISENVQTLRENAQTFAAVIGEKFSDSRTGDQYGTLIAGAYLLTSLNTLTHEDACDWISDIVFPVDGETKEKNSDEVELWNYLTDRTIRFTKTINNGQRSFDKPISELIEAAAGMIIPDDYAREDAEKALAQRGIKVIDDDKVAISNTHSAIGDLIARSRFGGLEWNSILFRLKGASVVDKAMRFGSKVSKYITIPIDR